MGFLEPGIFGLGAGLLLVILASYLLRPKRPQRRVSSTFLWLAALHDLEAQRPWRRIPPTLLLLLQIAALALMVGAVARPFFWSTQATGPFAVVLLDASASMQATDVKPSRFQAAKDRVTQLINAMEPGQELALVSLDAHPHVVVPPTSDSAALEAGVRSVQATAQSADLQVALSTAGSIAEDHQDAQIIVVGDGSLDRSQVPQNFPLPIRYVGIGTSGASNLAIAGLTTRQTTEGTSALARVVNYGPSPVTANLTLKVDGNTFDSRDVSVDPNSATTEQWDTLPSSAHTIEAHLDTQDSFALDKSAWAVLSGGRPTRILLVSDGNVFVDKALSLRDGTQVTRLSPSSYPPQSRGFDLVVFDGYVPPSLPPGASVLFLHPPLNNTFLTVGPDVTVSSLSAVRSDDPLVANVPLEGVHISRARKLTTPAWADTVLTSPETPLLVVGEPSGQRMGVLGFDVHQSDLPLQPGFPVLMQHLLDWLVPASSTATPVVQVGDSVSLIPLPDSVAVSVTTPDGQRVQLAPPLPPPAFDGTTMPGLYTVTQRDATDRQTTSYFAVNFVNPTESQLKPGTESGAPSVGARNQPLREPLEFWEGLAVAGLVLLALEAALAWWQFTAASLRARLALALRLIIAGLLVAALVGVSVPQVVNRQATVFVADTSASVASAQSVIGTFINQAVAAKHPDDAYAIVSTSGSASTNHVLTSVPPTAPLDLQSPQSPDATDLAAGLRLGADLLPTGYRQRLVLLSDGQETTGDAIAQARSLRARGATVDVVPLSPATGPEVLVDSVSAPQTVSEGQRFSIGVRLVSNVDTDATVHVAVNDQPVADQDLHLTSGTTNLQFNAQAPQVGVLDVKATVDAAQDTLPQNNEARAVVEVQGPPRVLIVEQRPGEGDTVASALQSTGIRFDRLPVTDMPDQTDALGSYSAVVLADVSAQSLTDAQQTTLRSYVRDLGRGLFAIGGDTSFGQGQYIGTPLDDALPVRSSVRSHTDQGRVGLLLVIDTSGSMSDDPYHEGTTKLDMAKQAALLSAQTLSPRDEVGIMTFDSAQHWTLPITPLLGMPPTLLQDRLAPLMADGGTDIFPALSAAFNAIKDTDVRYKHIILMTDGESCCGGDYATVEDRMRAADVTLSTIAVGADADTQLLSQLAKDGDGRYYFAEHARDIPRLMTRETELATRGPLVEGNITPRAVAPDATLSSLAAGGLPQLGGYLVTTPKDLAEVLLVSDAADPLLARWQYGLGRAAAWTSDLRGRWSQDWLQWPGTAQLFSSMIEWTIAPTEGQLHLSLRSDGSTAYVTVDEATTATNATPAQVHANVAQPGGAPLQLDLSPTGPGEYSGSFPLNGPGAYIVRVNEQRDGASVGTAEAGLPVSYPAEFRQVTPDLTRMQQIAIAGGGRVLATPADAFADDLPPVTTPLPLQRVLVLIAAILFPLEVALRRVRLSPADLLSWLRHPHRIAFALPRWSPELPIQSPSWLPGAWKTRPAPPPFLWRARPTEVTYGGHVTPGLARDTTTENGTDEDDALGATLRWLAARRGSTADRG